MKAKPLTTPNPPLSGGEPASGRSTATPSPDKGRAGEGFRFQSYDKRLTALARENRQVPTPAENLLWQKVLRGKQFGGYKFHRQKPIGPYIVDFYCAELKLVIEIDGDSHAEQPDYDAQRTAFLESHGLHVLRYANRDILNNLPSVFEHLQTQLEILKP
jgi:very-short-patch-repair endonuclease